VSRTKNGVRGLVPIKPPKLANRNVEQVPVVGAVESSVGFDKKSGRQPRLIGLTPPLSLGRIGRCARTSEHDDSPG
jgi:hypothetical protein